ncbi:MAG: cardiolipin synthase [Gemmataceae bacterium]|nr:cardiolipin synthase [Gemmataceae bacterium]
MWTEPTTWGWVLAAIEWTIRFSMLVIVPFRRSPSAAKGWLLLIFFEPILGLLIYWVFGSAKLPAWRCERMAKLPSTFEPVTKRLRGHPNVFHPNVPAELSQAVVLAENLGHMPILGGNAVELLSDYHGSIDRLVADIHAARNHVHLLFYIFADDKTTAPVVDALRQAAQRGVVCRVLVDAMGSRAYLPTLAPKLTNAGVRIEELLPVSLWRWKLARPDLRNHRKIAVIDGHIGYTGSQNLVDPLFKEGITYEELVVRVTGPAVLELQYVFAADWYLETDEVLSGEDTFPGPESAGDVPIQALPSGPTFPASPNQRLLVGLVHAARHRIVLTTPYFVPDEPLLQALQTAVLRGVEVHFVVSEKADQLLVSLAQKSYYEELLEAGAHIHRYRRHFLHAKHVSVDDAIALIGSSNVDMRSFSLNAEITLLFYDAEVAGRLRAEQDRYLKNCKTLVLEDWVKRPWLSKVCENLARLMSPLL